MMPKLIRFFLVLLGIFVLSLRLEPFFKRTFQKPMIRQKVNFSEVLNDFVVVQDQYDTLLLKSVKIGIDMKGKTYTNSELMDILPSKNISQLVHENRFPDTIRGQHVTPDMIQSGGSVWPLFLGSGPSRKTLAWMFESNTLKPRLELPDDMFRLTDTGMEFVRTARNRVTRVDHEKSSLFTEKMKATGLTFPVKQMYGDRSVERSISHGYFMVDSKDGFYQVSMADGLPVCTKIALPEKIKSLEGMNMIDDGEYFGYIYDQDFNIYLLGIGDYQFKQLPIYDYKQRRNMIVKYEDYFFHTFNFYDEGNIKLYVLDKDYNLVASMLDEPPLYENTKVGQFENYLFPFRFYFSSGKLNFEKYDLCRFIYLNVALTLLFTGMKLYRRRSFRDLFNWLDFAVVLVFGIYGFIAAWLFPNRK